MDTDGWINRGCIDKKTTEKIIGETVDKEKSKYM